MEGKGNMLVGVQVGGGSGSKQPAQTVRDRGHRWNVHANGVS